jgi:hypothetical protein
MGYGWGEELPAAVGAVDILIGADVLYSSEGTPYLMPCLMDECIA